METPTSQSRSLAIDVFRGATVAAMILVNAEFSHETSYRQLAHAAWDGWTFADSIFPCFLFIVGVSLSLSTAARVARGQDRGRLAAHAARRTLLLFACGVLIDYLQVPSHSFPFIGVQEHLQLSGVLQKISICYFLAFVIFLWAGLRGVIVAICGFNLLYLGLLYFFPVPGCGAGLLTVDCNFPGYVDELVLDGFRWNSAGFDPDGVGALLPATTSVLFGVLAQRLALRSDRGPRQHVLWLVSGGLILVVVGELLAIWVPINKQLWTGSFAVLMAGLAALGLAAAIWLVESGHAVRRGLVPLEILGRNAIAAYLVSRLVVNVPRVHLSGKSLYDDLLARIASPPIASLLFAIVVLTLVFVVIWLLHRRQWYLRF